MKKFFKVFMSLFAIVLGAVLGTNGVVMAAAADLPDAGLTNSDATDAPNGIASETMGRKAAAQDDNDELYAKEIDERIVKIRPMATPVDQISRYAKAGKTDSFEVKYYSVGTRPIKTTMTVGSAGISAQTSGTTVSITVADPTMFTVDDTIRVVGKPGNVALDGTYNATAVATNPDLVLCVAGKDASTGNITVYAVNGLKDSNSETTYVPAFAAGTYTLVRMGKACAELDVQTGRFNNIPTKEVQYCQNFMIQVEQSTFDSIAKKEINWTFSDIEEDGIYDMRLAQENSYLFGFKNCIHHSSKDGMAQWFTGGIWYMAGKDLEIGTYSSSTGKTTITDNDLVELSKDLFIGTGIGNKRKVLLCGSEFLAALSKIDSEKFRLKDTVEVWNLKFKSWETDFGEILSLHHELFDANGMSDKAFALDPEFLSKRTHLSWSRNVLDLKKAGVRNTNAVVLQEVACLYLRYAKAHARVSLSNTAA